MSNTEFMNRYNLNIDSKYWYCVTSDDYTDLDIGSYNIQEAIDYTTEYTNFHTLVVVEIGKYSDNAVLEIALSELMD